MTSESIEQTLAEIRELAKTGDDEAAHSRELELHDAFIDHVARLDLNAPSHHIQINQMRELARLIRSSRKIAFRRGI